LTELRHSLTKKKLLLLFLASSFLNTQCTKKSSEEGGSPDALPKSLQETTAKEPPVSEEVALISLNPLSSDVLEMDHPAIIPVSGSTRLPDYSTVLIQILGEPGEIANSERIGVSSTAFVKDHKFQVFLLRANFKSFPPGRYRVQAMLVRAGGQPPFLRKELGNLPESIQRKMFEIEAPLGNPDKHQKEIAKIKKETDSLIQKEAKELESEFKKYAKLLKEAKKLKTGSKASSESLHRSLMPLEVKATAYRKKALALQPGNLKITYQRLDYLVSLFKELDQAKFKSSTISGSRVKALENIIEKEVSFRIETLKNGSFY